MFTPFIIAFVLAVVIMPLIIPLLRRLKFGQSIREIGPSWHNKKSGTPTMGGVGIIAAVVVAVIIVQGMGERSMLLLLGALSFGIIGFLDDFIKVSRKQNLGLRAGQKSVLQVIAALAFVMAGMGMGILDTSIDFFGGAISLGSLYIPFAVLTIVGGVNAVNLTDGLDGLATCVTAVVMLFFAVFALLKEDVTTAVFSISVVGALLGFLVYNAHPARVFMGDCGSLFLGGAVMASAYIMRNPLILLPVGIIYIAETMSVIIQVVYFKFTKKRVFRMSPIHHHYEMCGWRENKIVLVFSLITLLGSVAALSCIYFGIAA